MQYDRPYKVWRNKTVLILITRDPICNGCAVNLVTTTKKFTVAYRDNDQCHSKTEADSTSKIDHRGRAAKTPMSHSGVPGSKLGLKISYTDWDYSRFSRYIVWVHLIVLLFYLYVVGCLVIIWYLRYLSLMQ